MTAPITLTVRLATPTAQLFEHVLHLEREGLTRTAAFCRLAEQSGASQSAIQSRFYDEARRRGGIPQRPQPRPRALHRSRLHPLFDQYLVRLAAKRVTPEHLAKVERALRSFQAHLARSGVDPTDVPYVVAQAYVDGLLRRCRPQTVQKTYLTAIAGAYRFAHDLGMAVPNPARLVVVPREPDRPPATYSNAELRRLLGAAQTAREDLLLHLFIYTGMRRSEVLGLRFDQIDWQHNVINVLGKGHPPKFRRVPIHPTLRLLLLAGQRGSRCGQVDVVESNRHAALGRDRLHQITTGLARRAEVEWRGLHAFRKTVSSVLYEEGVRESWIEAILGHAPRSVNARHYRRVPEAALHDAILMLYRSDPLSPISPI
jgi:integrase